MMHPRKQTLMSVAACNRGIFRLSLPVVTILAGSLLMFTGLAAHFLEAITAVMRGCTYTR